MSDHRGRRARAREDRAKRVFDVVVAAAALFLLSPLILVVAIVVRRSIGSPVLFRQQRPGLHGVPFTICKFRTMSDVRDADGRTIPDDLRTPPVGRFLRSSSLDELPELWNVLRGEMSMVGPRPLLMAYLARYTPTQMRRHEVRPGVTGLAQVSGRNAMTWEQKFALDIRYVDEHDLRMDLAILVRTARIVLAREGVRHGDGGQGDMPEFMGSDAGGASEDGRDDTNA